MLQCMLLLVGHFFLELKGLHPGRYHYKYIIDNTWAVDPSAPMSLDSQVLGWQALNLTAVTQPLTSYLMPLLAMLPLLGLVVGLFGA
jgi:hypothetical protein